MSSNSNRCCAVNVGRPASSGLTSFFALLAAFAPPSKKALRADRLIVQFGPGRQCILDQIIQHFPVLATVLLLELAPRRARQIRWGDSAFRTAILTFHADRLARMASTAAFQTQRDPLALQPWTTGGYSFLLHNDPFWRTIAAVKGGGFTQPLILIKRQSHSGSTTPSTADGFGLRRVSDISLFGGIVLKARITRLLVEKGTFIVPTSFRLVLLAPSIQF